MDWSSFAVGAGKTLGGFIGAQSETRAKNKVREAQNKNAKITGAHNAGVISQNRAQIKEEGISTRVRIQRARMEAESSANVAAALAGVKGGSVNATRFDIARSAAERTFANVRGVEAEVLDTYSKEYQNEVNTTLTQQTMLSGPSFASMALGLAGDFMDARAEDTGSDGTGVDRGAETTRSGSRILNIL